MEGLTSELTVESYNLSNIGAVGAGGAVDPTKSDRFRAILREELERLAREPVSAGELDLAKKLLSADTIRDFESNEGVAAFRADRLLYGQPVSRDAYMDEMQRLTAEELLSAAREAFAPDRLRDVEIRPARGFGKVLAILRYLLFRRL
jgi:predicted Zn-dependent peptidase